MLTMEDGPPRWTGYSTQLDSMHSTDTSPTNKPVPPWSIISQKEQTLPRSSSLHDSRLASSLPMRELFLYTYIFPFWSTFFCSIKYGSIFLYYKYTFVCFLVCALFSAWVRESVDGVCILCCCASSFFCFLHPSERFDQGHVIPRSAEEKPRFHSAA